MVSLFNALNISTNALTVNESAISVVSHNVANMNTEGYSKQKVNLGKESKNESIVHTVINCGYGSSNICYKGNSDGGFP